MFTLYLHRRWMTHYVQMSVRTTIIIITTHVIKLNFIDRLQFVFYVIYILLFRTCWFHCYALTTKSMNVTGYTSSSSNVSVYICSHKWAKIVFFLFRLHTSPNNRRRLLLERRVTLLKYLVLQYTNRASKNWDD